jgi:hypothetical protein
MADHEVLQTLQLMHMQMQCSRLLLLLLLVLVTCSALGTHIQQRVPAGIDTATLALQVDTGDTNVHVTTLAHRTGHSQVCSLPDTASQHQLDFLHHPATALPGNQNLTRRCNLQVASRLPTANAACLSQNLPASWLLL